MSDIVSESETKIQGGVIPMHVFNFTVGYHFDKISASEDITEEQFSVKATYIALVTYITKLLAS